MWSLFLVTKVEKNKSVKRIVLIGAGNVATHLAKALYVAGYELVQVYSRSLQKAELLATEVRAQPCCELSELQKADLYIYSVSDSALLEVIEQVQQFDGIHVHTTGSVDMAVFESKFRCFGVLYPLQTFSKDKYVDFKTVPLFLEACSNQVLADLQCLALSVSDICNLATSEQRIKLHIAAVFACNFSNYFYTIANNLLENEGISFNVLTPLINETSQKIAHLPPYDAQTGPARRNDQVTIEKHMQLLTDPNLKELYSLLSERIVEMYK